MKGSILPTNIFEIKKNILFYQICITYSFLELFYRLRRETLFFKLFNNATLLNYDFNPKLQRFFILSTIKMERIYFYIWLFFGAKG
ncbi:hypothetical protein BpHYR1_042687 [Brachionus plicatilis]|uniref:Uncharacterized protein n=1 Tax=Brachionus plicatilis TaxID=10195 RepID=A0A3M7QEE5_BRAPC|nr:hypothetical protein BpHYR1_042687 [Brachionus plicatilis]